MSERITISATFEDLYNAYPPSPGTCTAFVGNGISLEGRSIDRIVYARLMKMAKYYDDAGSLIASFSEKEIRIDE